MLLLVADIMTNLIIKPNNQTIYLLKNEILEKMRF
jgi:hypothetical protein